MTFYRQNETRDLIENCYAWAGDGGLCGVYGGCTLKWSPDITVEERRERRARYATPVASDASFTERVLTAMDHDERAALKLYHVDGRTQAALASTIGVHRNTVRVLLTDAHVNFWRTRSDLAIADTHRQREMRALHVSRGADVDINEPFAIKPSKSTA